MLSPITTYISVARSGRASEFGRREIKGGKGSVFDKGARRVWARLLAPTSCTLGPKRLRKRAHRWHTQKARLKGVCFVKSLVAIIYMSVMSLPCIEQSLTGNKEMTERECAVSPKHPKQSVQAQPRCPPYISLLQRCWTLATMLLRYRRKA